MLLACAGTTHALDPDRIETHVLDNGLKVVLWPDHSIPNLAMYNFFRVGSRNERPGITGLSHFFEHMMFLGSKEYGPGEFDNVMEAAGGANNAFTAQDITVYQNWFPRTALETIFTIEADRIAHLLIDSTSVESERGVVASERRRSVEDSNVRSLDEENWAAAYKAHPYQWPVIGWMVDIENWKIQDLYDYFHIYYAPNNATMVLVGAFEPDELLAKCRQYFEPIPRGPEPPKVTTMEPEQLGERRTELHRPAQVASILSSWHIPSTSHADYYALRVLEALLLQGESSRLYRRLIEEEELALRVFGGMDYALDPTLFQVFMQVRDGIDPGACEAALYEEIERLQQRAPSERELRKAKNQLAADFYRQLQTISGKALALGFSDVYFGDPKAFLHEVERYEAIRAEDLQRVARTWLQRNNRTVSTLVPKSAAEPEVGS
ncbi:MAG: insulinase family protein [Candidatus Latescibacterota bacterium]|nr:MAG: insulinase family protein [Candidatus Latescibacterota bacterium]